MNTEKDSSSVLTAKSDALSNIYNTKSDHSDNASAITPPDGGRGWLVVAGSFLVYIICQ
ncbi:hypothetical protein BD560DRAFT_408689 [Blakeslea trispora]|nr:hypothetical protein BD560DRAFT_408689 [Blakeslea trispora]